MATLTGKEFDTVFQELDRSSNLEPSLYFIIIFNWKIIALQCCVLCFCCTTRESAISICMSPPPKLPSSAQPHPLQVIAEHRAELPVLNSSFLVAVCFKRSSVYISVLLSQFLLPSPSPPCSQVHSLCLYSVCSRLFAWVTLFNPTVTLSSGFCHCPHSVEEVLGVKTWPKCMKRTEPRSETKQPNSRLYDVEQHTTLLPTLFQIFNPGQNYRKL